MHQLRSEGGAGGGSNSSPVGSALLARKVERQREGIDRPMPRSGDAAGDEGLTVEGDLQKPPVPASRGGS